MISAPRIQNLVKWTGFCTVAWLCMSLISIIRPLQPTKTQSERYQEQQQQQVWDRLNRTVIYDGAKPQQYPNAESSRNPDQFSFVLLEPDVCSNINKSNVFRMLIVVHSAPRHFKSRQFIRETWGDKASYPSNRVLFILGLDNSSATQQLVEEESRQYRDIIQEDFTDTYHNLTYKAVAWLKYVGQYCPDVDFVLKVDDDVVVNMRHVTKFLRVHHGSRDSRTIYCLIWYKSEVQRKSSNRWHLSKEDYRNDHFPDYCSGSAYILTNDIISLLYKESLQTPFFWIDDIYITGLLVKRYNDKEIDQKGRIRHYDLSARYILSKRLLADHFLQSFAMFAHVPGSVNGRHWFWDEMHKRKANSAPQFAHIADAAIRLS